LKPLLKTISNAATINNTAAEIATKPSLKPSLKSPPKPSHRESAKTTCDGHDLHSNSMILPTVTQ
jgi:hypothetical protein